jgi:hypothetical protein
MLKSLYGSITAGKSLVDEQSGWSEQEFSFEERLQYDGSIYILCEDGDFSILLNAVDDELYFSTSETLLLNKRTYLFNLITVAPCNNSITLIDNTQLSLYTWVIKEKWALTIHIFNRIQSQSVFNRINASGFSSGFSVRVLFTWVLMFVQHLRKKFEAALSKHLMFSSSDKHNSTFKHASHSMPIFLYL